MSAREKRRWEPPDGLRVLEVQGHEGHDRGQHNPAAHSESACFPHAASNGAWHQPSNRVQCAAPPHGRHPASTFVHRASSTPSARLLTTSVDPANMSAPSTHQQAEYGVVTGTSGATPVFSLASVKPPARVSANRITWRCLPAAGWHTQGGNCRSSRQGRVPSNIDEHVWSD